MLSLNSPPPVFHSSLDDIIPPWSDHTIPIDLNLTKFSKNYTHKRVIKAAYVEMISWYPYHVLYITDDSKNKTGVGAVSFPSGKLQFVSSQKSILMAELYAIKMVIHVYFKQ